MEGQDTGAHIRFGVDANLELGKGGKGFDDGRIHTFDGIETDALKALDDDGKPRRTGNCWTASAHIVTAVIGSGVLSLAWSFAQIGWLGGPVILFAFGVCTWFTSRLLADCYRYPDVVTGARNYIYMDAVRVNVSARAHKFCGITQYGNLIGTSVGYTIGAATSAVAVQKVNCYHAEGEDAPCLTSTTSYIVFYGIIQIFCSQIPNFGELWWLSYAAAVMSFIYAMTGLSLAVGKAAGHGEARGSLTGVKIGAGFPAAHKVWNIFSALGNMAFAYSFSMILIEIEDTIGSPPAENKQMRRAVKQSTGSITLIYMAIGVAGYLAFGDSAPGNMLTGFKNPYWLVDIANVCLVVHLVGAYQVYTQPVFQILERYVSRRWKTKKFHKREVTVRLPGKYSPTFTINFFRLVWRSAYVVITTVVAMLIPFFNSVLGIIGAMAFWPLTVHFPVVMYMHQHKVPRWSGTWIGLYTLSFFCFLVSMAGVTGSVAGIIIDVGNVKPFQQV